MNAVSTTPRRLAAGLLAGLLLSTGFTPAVFSAAPNTSTGSESITLSPVSKFYKLNAGETRRDKLTVVNDGETDYNFTVYAAPYSVKGEDYDPDFTTVRKNTDIESWISFEQESYLIKAGETKTVNYTLSVPENATPGGHYGALFAETEATKLTGQTGVERKKRVGAIVYATVNGTYETGGKFIELNLPALQFKAPLKGHVTVENTGNADFTVDSTFKVTDVFGNKKYEATKDYQVLPGTNRKIPVEWSQSPGFGLYQATVSAKFLSQDQTKSVYVFMAPIWAYLLFVIALLGAVIYFIQKRR